MADSLHDDLVEQIDKQQVVAVIGAGVSMAATEGAEVAGWVGLLRHGSQRCREVAGLNDAAFNALTTQIDSGDLDQMIGAAELIERKLGAPHGGEFGRWLKETVGNLSRIRQLVDATTADPPVPMPVLGPPGIGKSTVTVKALHAAKVRQQFGPSVGSCTSRQRDRPGLRSASIVS